ncbi:MAG: hypothetical protein WDZ94_01910 [Patescibacteria group bacterium]
MKKNKQESTLYKYAESISIDLDQSKLSESKVSELLRLLLAEYLKGQLSIDDVSIFCGLLYGKLDLNSDLFSVLLMGAEIEWHIRHEPETAVDSILDLLDAFTDLPKDTDARLGSRKIERLLEKYYLWADADINQQELSLEEGEKIGVCIVEDYMNGKLSVDELSTCCGRVYQKLDSSLDVYDLFKEGSTISQDIRKHPSTAGRKIADLLDYFGFES